MIVDPADTKDWQEYSFVIVGSGFAGLFLAEKLAEHSKVLVIEAGSLDDPLSLGRGYYEIESSGHASPRLGMRLSAFGGTSNHWTGQSRPFSPTIFKNRPFLGIAGWPIDYRDFAHYLPEVLAWLNLPASFDQPDSSSLEGGLFADARGLATDRFFRARPLPKFGDPQTRQRFLEHPAIDVMVGTRVLDINLDAGGRRVADIEIATAAGGRTNIPVRALLLCAGGIENARLMLWSGRKYPLANPLLGGPNALTGKFYAEHPVYYPVDLFFDQRADLGEGISNDRDDALQHFMWRPDDALLERHKLLRFAVLLYDDGIAVSDEEAHAADIHYFRRPERYKATIPGFKFEQTPHTGSYVGLSDKQDRDGTALAHVHWEVLPGDVANYRRATMLFCGLVSQGSFARARVRPEYRQADWTGIAPSRSSHHIGTTRMAHAPAAGVVDTDCKVFGLENLYVSGSSVFPNGDYLNPTLNFLALAARLGRKLSTTVPAVRTAFRFGSGRDGNHYLRAGWSHAEDRGVWTDGPLAQIEVPGGQARRLRLRGHAYRQATVVVSVNGVQLYNGPANSLDDIDASISPGVVCDISMAFDQLLPPFDVGESGDRRKLGFFLEWLELS